MLKTNKGKNMKNTHTQLDAINYIINNKPKGNVLMQYIKKAFPQFRKKIFTFDIHQIAQKIEEYQEREDWGTPLFTKKLYAFIFKNLQNASIKSGVSREYFRFNQNTLPLQLLSPKELRQTPKEELLFKEVAMKSMTADEKIVKYFVYERNKAAGYRYKFITKYEFDFMINRIEENQKNLSENASGIKSNSFGGKKLKNLGQHEDNDISFICDTCFLIVPYDQKDSAIAAGAKFTYHEGKRIYYSPKETLLENSLKEWSRNNQLNKVRTEYQNMTLMGTSGKHPEEEFAEIIRSLGLEATGSRGGGGIELVHNASSPNTKAIAVKELGSKSSKKPGSYKLAVDEAGFYYGWVINNKTGQKKTYNQRTDLKIIAINKEIDQIEEQERIINRILIDRETARIREEAAKKCENEFLFKAKEMTSNESSDYMRKKDMDIYPNIRVYNKTIYIGMFRLSDPKKVVSHQRIGWQKNEETEKWEIVKRNAYQAEKNGVCTLISKSSGIGIAEIIKMDVVFLAEGVSTAASVNKATGLPVIVTVDAWNLIKVAADINRLYPEKKIIVLADNDHHKVLAGRVNPNLKSNQKENTGLKAAKTVEKQFGGNFILPRLTKEDLQEKLSDWNDIHIKYGIDEVRTQIKDGLNKLGFNIETMEHSKNPKKAHHSLRA